MGFDAETRDGHRIYWPEKRKVSVERSVKFNFKPDEVIVESLPLEGEKCNDECLTNNESKLQQGTHQDEEPITIEPKNRHICIENSQMRKDGFGGIIPSTLVCA